MILAAGLVVAAPVGANAPEWLQGPDAAAELVPEPVFGGRAMLYRAGSREKPAVVLVHGLGQAGARDWAPVIPALAERHAVYALDLPGFGQSDKGNHLYTPDNFARVLEETVARRVGQPFALMGHSMGGAVALAYAGAYPQRLSRLILVDAAGVLHRSVYAEYLGRVGAQRAMGLDSPWFDQVLRSIQNRADSLPVRTMLALEQPLVRQRVLRGDPNAISAFALVEHDFSRTLRAIATPTLILWGADDSIAPVRTGQALASAIAGARLIVLPGLGHAPQLEAPGRFNPIVLDELAGLPTATPYALHARSLEPGRVAHCDGKRDAQFSGDYDALTLENCRDAHISGARIARLRIESSTALIVNSHLLNGMDAKDARVEITGGVVSGSLVLDATSVDAAGTRFESAQALARNRGQVTAVLRFSVSEVSPTGYAPRGLHDIVRLAPGETLIR